MFFHSLFHSLWMKQSWQIGLLISKPHAAWLHGTCGFRGFIVCKENIFCREDQTSDAIPWNPQTTSLFKTPGLGYFSFFCRILGKCFRSQAMTRILKKSKKFVWQNLWRLFCLICRTLISDPLLLWKMAFLLIDVPTPLTRDTFMRNENTRVPRISEGSKNNAYHLYQVHSSSDHLKVKEAPNSHFNASSWD